MTAQLIIAILVAAMALVVTGFAVVIWMLRDYAMKYKKAVKTISQMETKKRDKRLAVPRLGTAVRFHDTSGSVHDALVTAVHSRGVNLAIVSKDETRNDGYGRELSRVVSVPHKSMTDNGRYYFRFLDEEPIQRDSRVQEIEYNAAETVTGQA